MKPVTQISEVTSVEEFHTDFLVELTDDEAKHVSGGPEIYNEPKPR